MNESEIRSLSTEKLVEIKDQILKTKGEFMANEDRLTKLEASVAKLIASFKAQEEEVKKTTAYGEEEEAKAEEALKAEEEEAKKMIPVSKVAEEELKAEEEKDEEKEEKEKKDEEKIEKLEAQIARIAAYVASHGAITPDTPEDEPSMTTHKIPKVSNEPVKSDKPKEGAKVPYETPSMKPGKLKATAGKQRGQDFGFTGATGGANKEDLAVIEQKAVDEVFSFAAERGVTPMHVDYRVKTIKL